MKRTVTFLFVLFCTQIVLGQHLNHMVNGTNGKPMLLGQINRDGLTTNPFNAWFSQNYEAYLVNDKIAVTIKDSLQEYKIKVFLGTWCGDSKREVPRFYKVLDALSYPEEQLEVVAVDRAPKAYKQSPTGEEKGLNIHRVPTFIFYKEGKEVNRIVESPKATFEHDIKAIIKGKYTANYRAANYLGGLIKTSGVEHLKKMEPTLVSRVSDFVKGSRELNTLGYVKLRAGKIEEAIYVFDLNTKIFPYKPNVFDSLGEAYFEAKEYELAQINYHKVLELNPKDKNAMKMIDNIKKVMK